MRHRPASGAGGSEAFGRGDGVLISADVAIADDGIGPAVPGGVVRGVTTGAGDRDGEASAASDGVGDATDDGPRPARSSAHGMTMTATRTRTAAAPRPRPISKERPEGSRTLIARTLGRS